MEEKEVLKRLGFKEEKELASIEQLQDYNISYAEDDENYFNLSDNDGKKPAKIIESFTISTLYSSCSSLCVW